MALKRGQAWGFDLMIAVIIFTSGIVAFYLYSLNYQTEAQETIDSLFYEGSTLSEDLLSEGFPANWNIGSVQKIGLTNNGKINQTKLEKFYNLSIEDYQNTISLFGIKDNYFMNFSEAIVINQNSIEGIGKPPINPKNIIKITRLTIYREKPTAMNIFIWN